MEDGRVQNPSVLPPDVSRGLAEERRLRNSLCLNEDEWEAEWRSSERKWRRRGLNGHGKMNQAATSNRISP